MGKLVVLIVFMLLSIFLFEYYEESKNHLIETIIKVSLGIGLIQIYHYYFNKLKKILDH